MRRIRRSRRPIILRHHDAPVRDAEAVDRPLEHDERGQRLVVRDEVAGLVDAQEGEVAVLADGAVLGAVDDEGRVAGAAEGGGVGVVDLEGDGSVCAGCRR